MNRLDWFSALFVASLAAGFIWSIGESTARMAHALEILAGVAK